MQRKIFIGIDLPTRNKNYLARQMQKWEHLPVIWTSKENLHITLVLIGYIEDEQSIDLCENVRAACEGVDIFDIFLEKIELGPDAQNPKMIWASGQLSNELKTLQENIERSLNIFVREKKAFRPHVTLGKIRKHKWEALDETPIIQEKIAIPLSVENITVFESTRETGEMTYLSLEVCPLQ